MEIKIALCEEDIEAIATAVASKLAGAKAEENDDDLLGGGDEAKEEESETTLEQVQDAIRAAAAPGKKTTKEQAKEAVKKILKKHGAEKGTDLDKSKYAAVVKELTAFTAAKK